MAVIGRPRPEVPTWTRPHQLPATPAATSAPASRSTSLAIMATTIERTLLRRALIAVCSVIPILVSYARLYRGMHHLSDVLVGAINGLICAGLAAHWARESHRTRPTSIGP